MKPEELLDCQVDDRTQLLERIATALESIAFSIARQQPQPAPTDLPALIDESNKSKHLILSAQVRCMLQRLGYDKDDWSQAKKLLSSTFDGKVSLKQLSIVQLTQYAQQLQKMEDIKLDFEKGQ